MDRLRKAVSALLVAGMVALPYTPALAKDDQGRGRNRDRVATRIGTMAAMVVTTATTATIAATGTPPATTGTTSAATGRAG